MEEEAQPRVLIFPFPAQGHVTSMLKLAELLSLSGIHVTFLNTHRTHHKLTRFSDIEARFSRFPGFRFQTISDGLPTGDFRGLAQFFVLIDSLKSVTKPHLKQMLISGQFGPNLTCIILDGLFNFIIDVDDEPKIPVFCFRTISACAFWAYLSAPKLIEDGQLPMRGEEDMDRMIKDVCGMENLLRCRDLPSFCRVADPTDRTLQYTIDQTLQSSRTHSLIFNTFEDLEGPILSRIRSLCHNNIYAIGPLHTHLKNRLSNHQTPVNSESFTGLWEVDRSCQAWLDNQPPKSVIYVSFGSVVVITNQEFMEFWHGLVKSRRRFLWVVRSNLVTGKDGGNPIPAELEEATRERGYMVEWAPQEEVITHEAIGGFLTHGGWNSTLESLAASVPMICWPFMADQQTNSRYVSEVWKVGLDMKDTCNRDTVAKMVNDLMGNKREELMGKAYEIGNLAKKSVSQGGSSHCDFERMIMDITSMNRRHREMNG